MVDVANAVMGLGAGTYRGRVYQPGSAGTAEVAKFQDGYVKLEFCSYRL